MTIATRPGSGATYAKRFNEGPVLGPDALKAARAAYALAWAEISSKVSDNPQSIQVAQLRLANAVLAVAGEHITNPEALQKMALRILATKLGRPY
jgi:hypothetical protein